MQLQMQPILPTTTTTTTTTTTNTSTPNAAGLSHSGEGGCRVNGFEKTRQWHKLFLQPCRRQPVNLSVWISPEGPVLGHATRDTALSSSGVVEEGREDVRSLKVV
ncbi:hypothetical protein E2C01_074550 [Portunus trituberculatus]|uniref:Uncharacterized protein n=1 Tax=Portunus trituberculatus TaxID=210409 RepID=A0A5B7I5Y2_PORTR|nr:hypothetical protein [Portunus trituberculatus]